MKSNFLIVFLTVFLLSACSHLDPSCLEANWYEIGRQDSTQGVTLADGLQKRRQICPLPPDSMQAKAYKNGFSAGLMDYCRFKTGYIYSLSQMEGEAKACPPDLKQSFTNGYEIGSYMKEIQSLQKDIQEKIQDLNKKLDSRGDHFSLINSPDR